MGSTEVNWEGLDKRKFFIYGAGMFSGVTLCLYPLTVIKTKQMTLPGISGGFKGARQTAGTIMRTEGMPGFYRGLSTVICGTIPARAVYLTTLEWVKSESAYVLHEAGVSDTAAAGAANFAGGAVASLTTQAVTVPIDVISQKQMVHGDETVVARHQHARVPPRAGTSAAPSGPAAPTSASGPAAPAAAGGSAPAAAAAPAGAPGPARTSGGASTSGRPPAGAAAAQMSSAAGGATAGAAAAAAAPQRMGALQMVRLIVRTEGVGGLYRGFGASVATFVPSSAVWWGAYGTYQKLLWSVLYGGGGGGGGGGGPGQQGVSTGQVMAVQTSASVLAGCTSSIVTTPLDLIKTRIQVSYKADGATPSFVDVARQILREDGPRGFLRGAVPRMANAALWGTCMVTVYEHLKRVCSKE